MEKQQYCLACYPNKVRSHVGIYLSGLFDIFFQKCISKKAEQQLPKFPAWCSAQHGFYRVMQLLGIVRFTGEFDKKDHYPRSWVAVEEARRRGIPIESIVILGRVTTYYRVTFGSKKYYYDAVPSRFLNYHLDQKEFVKKMCVKHAFPVSEGKAFWSLAHAMHYGKKLSFPLVVKPASGTHAYHVTAPVQNEEELHTAICLARKYYPKIIVERYLEGNLYRVTVMNFNRVYVARREAPNVVGDGVHSIAELIAIKNADPKRGETGQKDATLHKIPMQGTTEKALTRRRLTLDYVPKVDEKIILHSKTSIGSGGDIIEETPLLHPENKEMFRRVARLFGTDLVGFDVIADALSRPYHEQTCGIIEANSIPMLDFHHTPAKGAVQNAAGALWDGILADRRVRYLFPIMLAERALVTRFVWHMLDIFMPFIRDFLLRFRIVRMLSRRQRFLVGSLKEGVHPESAIAHLKMKGFEVVRPEWIDLGEIMGLRKLLDPQRQCHIRFFSDGEVRAHIEYAPEARPFSHLLEHGFYRATPLVRELLAAYIEVKVRPRRIRVPLVEKLTRKIDPLPEVEP